MSTISSIVSSAYNEQFLAIQGINTFNLKKNPENKKPENTDFQDSSDNNDNSTDNSGLSNEEYIEIQDLKTIDSKVRAHELAHISVGGRFAGGASYEYTVGPDNIQYAVAGEVPISLITGETPKETIQNMTQIIAAALAPSDPSPQDRSVASSANSYIQKAVAEIYSNNQNSIYTESDNSFSMSFYA